MPEPPVLTRRWTTKIRVLMVAIIPLALAVGASVLFQISSTSRSLVGVWKGTDDYGGQHFYEFRSDGSMLYWDVYRSSLDSPPEKRGPFRGTFHYENDAIIAKAVGFLGPRVGILKWAGRDTLHQEFDGHTMRQNLNYTRVPDPN